MVTNKSKLVGDKDLGSRTSRFGSVWFGLGDQDGTGLSPELAHFCVLWQRRLKRESPRRRLLRPGVQTSQNRNEQTITESTRVVY